MVNKKIPNRFTADFSRTSRKKNFKQNEFENSNALKHFGITKKNEKIDLKMMANRKIQCIVHC